ncbi:hypothetical protein [Paraburkholderia sp. RL18-085-BIA-A]
MEIYNKVLKAISAITMATATFVSIRDVQHGIFGMLIAILLHMWSEEK